FRRGDYSAAAQAMSAFVQQYPGSSLAPSAQFYWGSSLYATKEYRSAIQRLEAMVSAAPRHPRAADALLVIAGCQIELGDRSAARTTLQRIIRDYPDTPAANTARDRLQLLP
ncbi:MAG: tol-pal system protein YbgF, partial [Pigmentiphaga sp.]